MTANGEANSLLPRAMHLSGIRMEAQWTSESFSRGSCVTITQPCDHLENLKMCWDVDDVVRALPNRRRAGKSPGLSSICFCHFLLNHCGTNSSINRFARKLNKNKWKWPQWRLSATRLTDTALNMEKYEQIPFDTYFEIFYL